MRGWRPPPPQGSHTDEVYGTGERDFRFPPPKAKGDKNVVGTGATNDGQDAYKLKPSTYKTMSNKNTDTYEKAKRRQYLMNLRDFMANEKELTEREKKYAESYMPDEELTNEQRAYIVTWFFNLEDNDNGITPDWVTESELEKFLKDNDLPAIGANNKNYK